MKNRRFVHLNYSIIFGLLIFTAAYTIISADYTSYRDGWQQPKKVMKVIGVKPGMVIGEPGAGKGYFTFKLAEAVGDTGLIYANDIDDDKLDTLKEKIKENNVKNVITIKGKVTDPLFPKGKLDMVFMCYMLHDVTKRIPFLKSIKPSMKAGALLVILERDPRKTDDDSGHFMETDEILKTVKKAGYHLIRKMTFLKKDNIYLYSVRPLSAQNTDSMQ